MSKPRRSACDPPSLVWCLALAAAALCGGCGKEKDKADEPKVRASESLRESTKPAPPDRLVPLPRSPADRGLKQSGYGELLRVPAHKGVVSRVTWCPDMRHAVTTGRDGMICMWDMRTGRKVYQLDNRPCRESVCKGETGFERRYYSKSRYDCWELLPRFDHYQFTDESWLLVTPVGKGLRVWDLRRGRLVLSIAETPFAKWELSDKSFGDADSVFIRSYQRLRLTQLHGWGRKDPKKPFFALSPDGSQFSTLILTQESKTTTTYREAGRPGPARSSKDWEKGLRPGQVLVVEEASTYVSAPRFESGTWDLRTGKLVDSGGPLPQAATTTGEAGASAIRGHVAGRKQRTGLAITVSAHSAMLSAGADPTLSLRDDKTDAEFWYCDLEPAGKAKRAWATCFAVPPNGRYALVGMGDGTLRLVGLPDKATAERLQKEAQAASYATLRAAIRFGQRDANRQVALAFSPASTRLYRAGMGKRGSMGVGVLDLTPVHGSTTPAVLRLKAGDAGLWVKLPRAYSKLFSTGTSQSQTAFAKSWEREHAKRPGPPLSLAWPATPRDPAVLVVPGRYAARGWDHDAERNGFQVWVEPAGKSRSRYESRVAPIAGLSAPPGRPLLVSRTAPVAALSAPPGGRLLAAVAHKQTGPSEVVVCDVDAGKVVGRLALGSQRAHGAAFAPDGGLVAVACEDGAARLFHADTCKPAGMLKAEGGPLMAVAFSPDGRRLVGGGAKVFVWDVAPAKLVAQLPVGNKGARAAAFSPDGRWLATGDGTVVKLWRVHADK